MLVVLLDWNAIKITGKRAVHGGKGLVAGGTGRGYVRKRVRRGESGESCIVMVSAAGSIEPQSTLWSTAVPHSEAEARRSPRMRASPCELPQRYGRLLRHTQITHEYDSDPHASAIQLSSFRPFLVNKQCLFERKRPAFERYRPTMTITPYFDLNRTMLSINE